MDIYLREAHKRDIVDLYSYLNREHVRKYSIREKEEWFRHKRWYKQIIESDSSKLYIINDLKLNFHGLIRYDIDGAKATVSIFIPVGLRNQGIGKVALKKSLSIIKDEGIEWVEAEILAENQASIRLFEGLGFESVEEVDGELLVGKSLKG